MKDSSPVLLSLGLSKASGLSVKSLGQQKTSRSKLSENGGVSSEDLKDAGKKKIGETVSSKTTSSVNTSGSINLKELKDAAIASASASPSSSDSLSGLSKKGDKKIKKKNTQNSPK